MVDNLGPWFGGFQWRALGGKYPIDDGAGQRIPQDKGYSEFNADVGYKVGLTRHLKVKQFGVFNLNQHQGGFLGLISTPRGCRASRLTASQVSRSTCWSRLCR